VKSYYLSPASFTGCRNVHPDSTSDYGFAATPASAAAHRFWEFKLAFHEIGVDPTTWTTSSGATAHVRVNVGTSSVNPPFTTGEPSPSVYPNLTGTLFQIDLATFPSFPPGSTGPTFYGVGLVPKNYIDAQGFASIDVPGWAYKANDAPFGGSLNVFGNWFPFTAAKYRVMYTYSNGGPPTAPQPLIQTWTNFRLNLGTGNWDAVAFAPDATGKYTFPSSLFTTWYLPNLLVSWQTGGGFADGTYNLSLELFDAADNPLPAPAGNSLTLYVVNTPPVPVINDILFNGTEVCACAIVHQGTGSFTFNLSFTDPNGALDGVSFGAIYGVNQSVPTIFSTSYAAHNDEDGANRWNGETNFVVPTGPPFQAGTSCAYSFILSLSSRTQNGYGRLFSGVQYTTSITILTPGPAAITGCSGGRLLGKLSFGDDLASVGPAAAVSLRAMPKASRAVGSDASESGAVAGLRQK
jgi:hypothetical protein